VTLKIGLFAAHDVGAAIAGVFGDTGAPACLVLDDWDTSGRNARIAAASKCVPERVYSYTDVASGEGLQTLRALDLDLIVLAWWPYIVTPPLIAIPRLGCLNVHPSLLPHNRGKHYNFWALVEGSPFGVSIHFVDRGVDTGDVAFQSAIPTTWEDTGATLYEKAQREVVRLFTEKLPEIRLGRIPRQQQDLARGSSHRASELDAASRIDLDRRYTGRELLNLLRARTFPPHPAAWFEDDGRRYEVRIAVTPQPDESG
jgi:methionyl-tRNA formyltransferase